MFDCPLHGAAEIVVLRFEAPEPEATFSSADILIRIAPEAISPLRQSNEELVSLIGLAEPFEGKGAYDLQHAIASIRFGVLGGLEQAVLDEDRNCVKHIDPRIGRFRQDFLRCLHRKAAGEDPEAEKRGLIFAAQEIEEP